MNSYGSSTVKRRRRTQTELDVIDTAIITAVTDEHPVTVRGVYYRVVSAGAVEKTENGYRLICRQLLKLRRSRTIPYHWITDGTRWTTKPRTWTDKDQALHDMAASYRRALWHDQPVQVQIYSEKDAITGVIEPTTAMWDVPLGVTRGYASESFAWQVAESIRAARRAGKEVYIYDLGDHDPSGLDAWRAFEQRVTDFLDGLVREHDELGNVQDVVHFERLAVTCEQIDTFHLPTRPTKTSDSRAANFDGGSVEVDAIPPNTLREIVKNAISQHIDPEALRLHRIAEDSERQGLHALTNGGLIGGTS